MSDIPVAPRQRTPAAVIAGLGAWLPERAVSNAELCAVLDTTDEWIRSRTGIGNRYVVPAGTSTSDLATEAGRLALKSAGDPDVDAVVVATTTPDQSCPATAPAVAARLGLNGLPAYDVAAVCSGFVYGLANATGLILAGLAERVLLIAADTFSTIVDPTDRGPPSSSATARARSCSVRASRTNPVRCKGSTSAATARTRTWSVCPPAGRVSGRRARGPTSATTSS
jgi:3-oxoacyl-[acyl-carrier-protein] synthase-3